MVSRPHRLRTALSAVLATLAFAAVARGAPPFMKAARDHSLCCGLKVPINMDGDPLALSAHVKPVDYDDSPVDTKGPSAPTPISLPAENPSSKTETPSTPIPPPRPILRLPGPPLSALDRPLETQSGYAKIAFSQLAGFTFTAPPQPLPAGTTPPDVLTQVPTAIKRLDGKKVVLTGFMLPTKMEGGFATEFFFLSSSQLCCYGVTPTANEWMLVKMKKEGLPAVQDVPVALAGRLRVRAQWADGFLTSIYELEGDGLLKMKD